MKANKIANNLKIGGVMLKYDNNLYFPARKVGRSTNRQTGH